MTGFESDGVSWEGTKRELSAWKALKREKAKAFVEQNYSVAWYPDGSNLMEVYVPQRHHLKRPELRAFVKFFREPSKYGINAGKISKLMIRTRSEDLIGKATSRSYERIKTLFNYDRGPDVDWLEEYSDAKRLYDAVLRELG